MHADLRTYTITDKFDTIVSIGLLMSFDVFDANRLLRGLGCLLYRPSISDHAGNFLLKGRLLFLLWHGHPHGPTHDADPLGFGPDDVPTLVEVFRSVAAINVHDGIVFDP